MAATSVTLPSVWVKDVRWTVWHATSIYRQPGKDMYWTACGQCFENSDTIEQSYTVITTVQCQTCAAARFGQEPFRKASGRPRMLLKGPGLPKRSRGRPRSDGTPAQPRAAKGQSIGLDNPPTIPAERTNSYVRGDGRVITRTYPTKAERAAAAAAEVEKNAAEFGAWSGFEVGRRMAVWSCITCGATLVEGGRYCSRWCVDRDQMDQQSFHLERRGTYDLLRRQHYYATAGRPGWTPQVRLNMENPLNLPRDER